MGKINKVKKRDGRIVDFDKNKITQAIFNAANSIGGNDKMRSMDLTNDVETQLVLESFGDQKIPTVEQVQDAVEKVLIENGHAKTAKAYILYRKKHEELRAKRESVIGQATNIKLSPNALRVLNQRYFKKDMKGKVIETPEQLFRRVAQTIASGDEQFGLDPKEAEETFYKMMSSLEFLPNSPTLMNAGLPLGQLSACFVLPVGDSMEEIFETIKNTAIIHKTGGGTGFSFSRLRPTGDLVRSTKGVSSGPISFMKVFDAATNAVKQGGKRRGANMGILRVDHPDIMDFIVAKEKEEQLNNFNISVGITEKFMEAVLKDEDYELYNPRTHVVVKKYPAKRIFDLIVLMAWKNGEPGIVFLDRINRDNKTPHIGEMEATNPCGEQPLLPYEACNLGSINLSKFVKHGELEWERLKQTIGHGVHFLDNVITTNNYPLKEIDQMTKANRKIGLGVMGFADMLFKLKIPYNSEEGVEFGEKIMKFVNDAAQEKSIELGHKRGSFPNFKGSTWHTKGFTAMRNATVTTIAPTGTISMIADCSSGVEPLFAISFMKRVMDGSELLYVNEHFEKALHSKGIYNEDLLKSIANKGTLHDVEGIPEDIQKVFVVSHDVSPKWHLKMQAAFQAHCDNAVSKTVNFPNWATTKEVEDVYLYAYKLGCKGVTVYRDGSRGNQVLNLDMGKEKKTLEPTKQETSSDSTANLSVEAVKSQEIVSNSTDDNSVTDTNSTNDLTEDTKEELLQENELISSPPKTELSSPTASIEPQLTSNTSVNANTQINNTPLTDVQINDEPITNTQINTESTNTESLNQNSPVLKPMQTKSITAPVSSDQIDESNLASQVKVNDENGSNSQVQASMAVQSDMTSQSDARIQSESDMPNQSEARVQSESDIPNQSEARIQSDMTSQTDMPSQLDMTNQANDNTNNNSTMTSQSDLSSTPHSTVNPKEKTINQMQSNQTLNSPLPLHESEKCPECGQKMYFCEGCKTCPHCGFSMCSA